MEKNLHVLNKEILRIKATTNDYFQWWFICSLFWPILKIVFPLNKLQSENLDFFKLKKHSEQWMMKMKID